MSLKGRYDEPMGGKHDDTRFSESFQVPLLSLQFEGYLSKKEESKKRFPSKMSGALMFLTLFSFSIPLLLPLPFPSFEKKEPVSLTRAPPLGIKGKIDRRPSSYLPATLLSVPYSLDQIVIGSVQKKKRREWHPNTHSPTVVRSHPDLL